jgi:hypothetical protein
MTRGTNPFEDSSDSERESPSRSEKLLPSTNPFDSENDLTAVVPDISVEEDEFIDEGGGEASWHFLGDLPYRRVPIYSNVRWQRRSKEGDDSLNDGLAAFPSSYIRRSDFMDSVNARDMLANTTVTKVAGCPHGGPIAAMTLPILGASSDATFATTEIRIMTNSGHSLANIECPPQGLSHIYTAADIMAMGFTDRTVLIVVLRDSLCLTYDMSGNPVLPPFHILPSSDSGKGTDLLQASVYEGGVAVLSMGMQAAIAEFLDDHDASTYGDEIYVPTRRIFPSSSQIYGAEREAITAGPQTDALPKTYAIVSSLPTTAFAR